MSKEERKALAARHPFNPNPVTAVLRNGDGTKTLKSRDGAIVVIPDTTNAKKPRPKTAVSRPTLMMAG